MEETKEGLLHRLLCCEALQQRLSLNDVNGRRDNEKRENGASGEGNHRSLVSLGGGQRGRKCWWVEKEVE